MSPLTRSLLALAAAALLHGACADPVSQCATASSGKEVGVKRDVNTVQIPAGKRFATVELPTLCIDNINLGEFATACDDVAPTVHTRDWPVGPHWPLHTTVTVIRHGDYQNNVAVLDVSLWCPH